MNAESCSRSGAHLTSHCCLRSALQDEQECVHTGSELSECMCVPVLLSGTHGQLPLASKELDKCLNT